MQNAATNLSMAEPTVNEFVLTLFSDSNGSEGHSIWSHVWSAKNPIAIGYPFRWVLEKTDDGIRLRKLQEDSKGVINNPLKRLSVSDLQSPIKLGNLWLRIHPVVELDANSQHSTNSAWSPKPIRNNFLLGDEKQIRLAMRTVFGALLVCGLLIYFMPAAKNTSEELIPAQFAKVLLTPAVKTKQKVDARSSSEKKNEHNVVQAFRSESVQKSARNLFQGGGAKSLLAQSKLLDSAAASLAVKQVFGEKSSLVGGLQTQRGNTADPKAAKVGLIGGDGGGSGGLGYGSASGGAVSGQGSGMIGFAKEGLAVDEGLTKDEVGTVIRQHANEVRYCYESAIVRNPGFEGKLLVSFQIQASGAVKSAKAKDPSGDKGLDACILNRLVQWKFPKPRGGSEVGVSYPFIFKSLSN